MVDPDSFAGWLVDLPMATNSLQALDWHSQTVKAAAKPYLLFLHPSLRRAAIDAVVDTLSMTEAYEFCRTSWMLTPF